MIFDFIQFLIAPFTQPQQRLFLPVVVVNFIFLFLFLIFKNKKTPFKEAWSHFFSSTFLKHHTHKVDLFYFSLNRLLFFIFGLFVATEDLRFYSFTRSVLRWLRLNIGDSPELFNTTTAPIFYSLLSLVILDGFRFLQHWCFHNISFLWPIHKIHHTAEYLTPLTVHRVHPVEAFCSMMTAIAATVLCTTLYIFLCNRPVSGLEFLGVNAFSLAFNILGANLRHSHVPLSYGILEFIFISPLQHQIHHSVQTQHHNKNYGVIFSFWDLLFKSHFASKGVKEKLKFGVQ